MGDERRGGEHPRPWERLETRHLAEYEMFRVREDRSRSPRDGSEHTYHAAESPGGVCVVALTDDGEVVMVEQFRHGSRRLSLELPSGVVDDGEEPVQAARRELREETGYTGGEATVLGRIDLNPSWQRTSVHAVVIRGVRREREQDPDPTEDIAVHVLPVDELRRRVLSGEVNAGAVLSTLALWDWKEHGFRED